ncbi:hypothetical protein SERLA73DRAFT_150267 [Serpula lacrymans var. lacrymans S7.3]|uniref:Uncharacterized protein n=2 Tax=Serpula lacrymans var. lacrymans TaxID=341189 RepID=F8PLU0_SERL3|nr:uncharacterized protein SERLADRAFT_405893 [Serpula lacrymans var. lacrymans S7.9]EGO02572.1 hypothetical protein SERLA73DRAFT_150267 [Serpula lacrymans var. lacrymans S7.3]EGO28293.1 hypothetical protein SERLADRAFT_405893 [Serpula lacrymans var. lacrymans S7.9]
MAIRYLNHPFAMQYDHPGSMGIIKADILRSYTRRCIMPLFGLKGGEGHEMAINLDEINKSKAGNEIEVKYEDQVEFIEIHDELEEDGVIEVEDGEEEDEYNTGSNASGM